MRRPATEREIGALAEYLVDTNRTKKTLYTAWQFDYLERQWNGIDHQYYRTPCIAALRDITMQSGQFHEVLFSEAQYAQVIDLFLALKGLLKLDEHL